jgi:hypothetical protein
VAYSEGTTADIIVGRSVLDAAIGTEGSLAGDSDVAVSSPVAGQVLGWNGSHWVNVPAPALESLASVAAAGPSRTLDATAAAVWAVTLTANVTYAFATPPAGAWSFTLVQTQNGSGPWTVTWPGPVKWQDGIAPALTMNPGAIDVLVFTTVSGGVTWLGSLAGVNFS